MCHPANFSIQQNPYKICIQFNSHYKPNQTTKKTERVVVSTSASLLQSCPSSCPTITFRPLCPVAWLGLSHNPSVSSPLPPPFHWIQFNKPTFLRYYYHIFHYSTPPLIYFGTNFIENWPRNYYFFLKKGDTSLQIIFSNRELNWFGAIHIFKFNDEPISGSDELQD